VKKPDLVTQMGKRSLKAVTEGDFSIGVRNEHLAEIYERSLNEKA
jgi:hypothetical protein